MPLLVFYSFLAFIVSHISPQFLYKYENPRVTLGNLSKIYFLFIFLKLVSKSGLSHSSCLCLVQWRKCCPATVHRIHSLLWSPPNLESQSAQRPTPPILKAKTALNNSFVSCFASPSPKFLHDRLGQPHLSKLKKMAPELSRVET